MIRFLGRLEELDFDGLYPFPPVDAASPEGIVCAGGNLSPGMLLSAYRQGIFPWYSNDEPILWWSPNPRFAILPETLHISRSSLRLLRQAEYSFSLDRNFRAVMEACAKVPRPGQDGTWILPEMIEAYTRLHRLGYAHSLEVWKQGLLVGGLYGVSLGGAFFGESMFSLSPGASRAGFLSLALWLFEWGFLLIDSQVHTLYVETMGGVDLPRGSYLAKLDKALRLTDRRGNWNDLFPEFPRSAALARILGPNLDFLPQTGF
ncbi:MAG: leucyl/phenylalanyl-tRNA--protein transferase [Spirochaetia bacterium]|jgi:leucyl/phenylalanyl-tRNA--protein transferase|nr:leucyl/phenylalanyl-tRNA--protein transferase [Spirochaetales bacterium]MDX9783774.1 leucyl/phenylalanyl-tRNA--protein transferase [Spirochaetia bacterium]